MPLGGARTKRTLDASVGLASDADMAVRYGKKGARTNEIDVSRYASAPFRALSPFAKHSEIPVPGRVCASILLDLSEGNLMPSDLDEAFSNTVEGIWQGLKVIDGQTERAMFTGRVKKRRGRPSGHDFGYRIVDYLSARALIYVPAYRHVLQRAAVAAVLDEVAKQGRSDDVFVVDVSFSDNPFSARRPLSHAKLIVDHLNGALGPYEDADRRIAESLREMSAPFERDLSDDELWPRYNDSIRRCADRVLELGNLSSSLDSYEAWAHLYERECLIAEVVRAGGTHLQIDPLRDALDAWVRAGIMTQSEANTLSTFAPMCRFSETWYSTARR